MWRVSSVIGTHTKSVTAVKFSPCEQLLVSASADQTCQVFRAEDGCHLKTLNAVHTEGLNDVVWMNNCSSNGVIATASDDKLIKIWDVETGQVISTLEGHENFVFSLTPHPTQSFLVSGSEDETLRLWDLRCAAYQVHALEAHEEPLTSVNFHPTGDHIVSSSYDGLARIWDFRTLACRRTFSLVTSQSSDTVVPIAHTQYSPNGNFILANCLDSSLRLIRPFHTYTYDTLSSEGEYYTVNVHKRVKRSCPVRSIQTVKMFSGHIARKYSCPASFVDASTMAVSDNEQEGSLESIETRNANLNTLILCGSEDHSICMWDLQTQELVGRLQGHSGPILALDYSPRHKLIASGACGSDYAVRRWCSYSSEDKTAVTTSD